MARILLIEDLLGRSKVGSALSIRTIIEDLKRRFYEKIQKTVEMRVIKDGDKYYVFHRIPSESNGDKYDEKHPIFYDTILEFWPYTKELKDERSIRLYGVKVYSNSPNFTFTFTYVFNSFGQLTDIVPKTHYMKEALKMPANVRNTLGLVFIEKTIFYSLYHLELTTGFHKNKLDDFADNKLKGKDFLSMIMTQVEKLEEIQVNEKRVRLDRMSAKEKAKAKKKIQKVDQVKSKRSTRGTEGVNVLKTGNLESDKGILRNELRKEEARDKPTKRDMLGRKDLFKSPL